MTLKLRNVFLTALIIILIASCTSKKKDYVAKFIYFKYCSISYDSANHPQINIRQYFEYKRNTLIKIATSGVFDHLKASKYGLFNFYNIAPDDTFNEMLSKKFCNKAYGKTCKQKIDLSNSRDISCHFNSICKSSFFIIETAENKKVKIIFDHDSLPPDMKMLYDYIMNMFNLKTLNKVNRFDVDNSVEEIQKQLFFYYPPPPPPPEALEQKVKFTVPVVIN